MTDANTIASRLHAEYQRAAGDWRRDHLGASIIGHKCDRYLWLAFRWAAKPEHEGRILRLFERGQREEAWVVDDLRKMGVEVQDRDPKTGEQWLVSWGHVGGSCDGIATKLPDRPDVPHVLEIKTTNAKGHQRLRRYGVKRAKPEHFVQMQTYMAGLDLAHAVYVSVCKDNDELYVEFVDLAPKLAQKHIQRARDIALEDAAPPRMPDGAQPPCMLTSADGTQWPCTFYGICHGEDWPASNCRTCLESKPMPDGTWRCDLHDCELSPKDQRAGCSDRVSVPGLVNAKLAEVDEKARRVVWQKPSGETVVEGASDA